MKKEILYEMKSLYRDDFQIVGYRFGSGEKTVAIVGSMRGDEIQQLYVCSQLVAALKTLETKGELDPDCSILVIPSCNPFSMNVGKRFWAMDGTDINRMFPGLTKERRPKGLRLAFSSIWKDINTAFNWQVPIILPLASRPSGRQ